MPEKKSAWIPFLASYPRWVSVLFAAWLVLGAALLAAFALGREQGSSPAPTAPEQVSRKKVSQQGVSPESLEKLDSTGKPAALLVVREIDAEAWQFEGPVKAQIQVRVNRREITYPRGGEENWWELGQEIPPLRIAYPLNEDGYEVTFALTIINGDVVTELASQWVETVKRLPFSGQYQVKAFHPGSKTSTGRVTALITYEIAERGKSSD